MRSAPVRRAALIVDLDSDTRQMYAECLRLADFEVDEADEGRQALAKALALRYDVIIMDTRLPGLDGYQLIQVLRRDASTQTVPIIVVTGDGSSSAVDRARKTGASAVLVKPALPDAMLAEILGLLDHPTVPMTFAEEAQRDIRVRKGHSQSRRHQRGETVAPPIPPPSLVCPRCDFPLMYQRSYIGGVSAKHSEQWDDYECSKGCGIFQYRQRTRKMRQI